MSGGKRVVKDVFWDVIFLIVAFIWSIPVFLFACVIGVVTLVKRFIWWIIDEIQFLHNKGKETLISEEIEETESIL